jgi:hypothetical protein
MFQRRPPKAYVESLEDRVKKMEELLHKVRIDDITQDFTGFLTLIVPRYVPIWI